MADEAPQNSPNKDSKGYGKRPLWQWVVVYLVVAAIVYGAAYYFFFMPSGTVSY
jgi:hypothetical protein